MKQTGIFNCVCCSKDFTLIYDSEKDVDSDRVSCGYCIAKQDKIMKDMRKE